MIDEGIVVHEAGHTAALIFAGRLPKRVRVDNPNVMADLSGAMEPDWGDGIDGAMLSDVLVSVLVGPLCEPSDAHQTPWPPPWDALDPEHPVSDAAQVARLARYLECDRARYERYVALAHEVVDHPGFKSLHALIAQALSRVPVIEGAQLAFLIGPERRERYAIETPNLEEQLTCST